jgi:hypothetical protein
MGIYEVMKNKNANPAIGPNRNELDGSIRFRSSSWNPKLPSKDAKARRTKTKGDIRAMMKGKASDETV